MKDQLYLLKPGFVIDGAGPFYCGDSVSIEGFLSFFPPCRELVDVHYLHHPRPRPSLVSLLGQDNQSLPVIVLAAGRHIKDDKLQFIRANGRDFLADERAIRQYLSSQYSLPRVA